MHSSVFEIEHRTGLLAAQTLVSKIWVSVVYQSDLESLLPWELTLYARSNCIEQRPWEGCCHWVIQKIHERVQNYKACYRQYSVSLWCYVHYIQKKRNFSHYTAKNWNTRYMWHVLITKYFLPCICSSRCVIINNIKLFRLTHLFFIVWSQIRVHVSVPGTIIRP
jgi:hypothetical protein